MGRSTTTPQTRVYLLLPTVLVGLIFFRLWTTSLDKQPEADVIETVSKIVGVIQQTELAQTQTVKEIPKPTETIDEQFSVNKRGFWEGLGATKGHLFDEPLAKALVEFWKKEKVANLLELGAGTGTYAKMFKENGIFVSCYDGNPNTQVLSDGRCGIIDLSKPLDFPQHEWVMSLEVGEHIPSEFESIYIQNLHKANKKGLIISWAVEGQGGTAHVNTHNNDYVKAKFHELGYTTDEGAEKELREKAFWGWFKNTVMVFRKA